MFVEALFYIPVSVLTNRSIRVLATNRPIVVLKNRIVALLLDREDIALVSILLVSIEIEDTREKELF